MEILKQGEKVTLSYVLSCKRCGYIWRAKEGEYGGNGLFEEYIIDLDKIEY